MGSGAGGLAPQPEIRGEFGAPGEDLKRNAPKLRTCKAFMPCGGHVLSTAALPLPVSGLLNQQSLIPGAWPLQLGRTASLTECI